jgi:hypothetical protein
MHSLAAIGIKLCTTRAKRYGQVGDYLVCRRLAYNVDVTLRLRLTTQVRTKIGLVEKYLYKQEGFARHGEFSQYVITTRKLINDRFGRKTKEYDPEQMVWVHWFGRRKMPMRLVGKLKVSRGKVCRLFPIMQKKLGEEQNGIRQHSIDADKVPELRKGATNSPEPTGQPMQEVPGGGREQGEGPAKTDSAPSATAAPSSKTCPATSSGSKLRPAGNSDGDDSATADTADSAAASGSTTEPAA